MKCIKLLLFFPQLFLIHVFMLSAQPDYAGKRAALIDKLKQEGIQDEVTLHALSQVPRHLFVPENLGKRAYENRPLPIGYGQTISQPYIVGFMTELLEPNPAMTVLEIGTGSGYQAAILAEIVDTVYTIEIIPELAKAAKQRLASLDYKNIRTKTGDGFFGWEEHAPFDAIIVTAAAEFIPPPLIGQLEEGGVMVIPLGSPYMTQQLMVVRKNDGKISSESVLPVVFVPFTRSR